MANKYGLPEEELKKIRTRDTKCVYCRKAMTNPKSGGPRRDWATIEHLNHLPPWNNPDTVVYCCGSCNSSRGKKKLTDWFEKSSYCKENDINEKTVADPVKDYLKRNNK